MSDPDHPESWLAKAENDLLCIRNNLDNERIPWDAMCFHAQQAAEKMLKACLVSVGLTAPRTHDLLFLFRQCLDAGLDLHLIEMDCRFLNPFAIVARYPTGPEPSESDGREAIRAAEQVRTVVRAHFAK